MKVFLLFILFCQISVDKLIDDLGNNNYNIRQNSYKKLKELEFKAIPSLIKNFENDDLEISLSCRRLYSEYLYLTDSEGEVPSIWYLEREHRFPLGCNVTYSKKKSLCKIESKKDISLEYFEKFRNHYFNSHHECFEESCWCYYCSSDICFYKDEEIAKKATKLYIKDYLMAGKDKKKLKAIIQKASNNMKNYSLMYQTNDIAGKDWDFWNLPPGILIEKENFVFPSR